jgi:hypothetical protein
MSDRRFELVRAATRDYTLREAAEMAEARAAHHDEEANDRDKSNVFQCQHFLVATEMRRFARELRAMAGEEAGHD